MYLQIEAIMAGKKKGIPHIAVDTCKGCGLCVSVCPGSVLRMNTAVVNAKGYNPVVVEAVEKCIACISCALICPDVAISIEQIAGKPEG